MDPAEEQWTFIESLRPGPKHRADGRGRPWRDPRDVLDGAPSIMRTGAPWMDLPSRYPPPQTRHRRFQRWCRDGTREKALHALAQDTYERGGIDVLDSGSLRVEPETSIGDGAYDSDALDQRVERERGMERIAPNR